MENIIYIYVYKNVNCIIDNFDTYILTQTSNLQNINSNFIEIYEVEYYNINFTINLLHDYFKEYIINYYDIIPLYGSIIIYYIDLVIKNNNIPYKKLSKKKIKMIQKMNTIRDKNIN